MSTTTTKLLLPRPVGSDLVTRANHNALVDALESNAAAQTQVDRPFNLLSMAYDNPNNRLVVTLGAGRAAFLATLVNLASTSTVYIASPTINTTYYVYLKSDGSFVSNMTGGAVTGAVLLWQVVTGGSLSTLSSVDQRGELPGASGRVVQDALTTHQTASVLDHPDGSVTNSKIALGAVTSDRMAGGAATGTVLGPDVIKTSTTAGGDLSGTYPSPTVTKLQGRTVANTAPSSGQNLQWNGSNWTPTSPPSSLPPTGSAGGDLAGTYPSPTIAAGAVTKDKLGTAVTCRMRHSVDQTIANNSSTQLSMNTVEYDTDTMADTANSRIVIKTAGLYILEGSGRFYQNANGSRGISIKVNGVSLEAPLQPASPDNFSQAVVAISYRLNVNDVVTLWAFQSSGGNLNVMGGQEYTPILSASRIGAL